MSTQHGLIRIFWPSGDYKSDVPGILVGWRNSVSDIFVAAILEDAQVMPFTHQQMISF